MRGVESDIGGASWHNSPEGRAGAEAGIILHQYLFFESGFERNRVHDCVKGGRSSNALGRFHGRCTLYALLNERDRGAPDLLCAVAHRPESFARAESFSDV
jgi:hypothetical protein